MKAAAAGQRRKLVNGTAIPGSHSDTIANLLVSAGNRVKPAQLSARPSRSGRTRRRLNMSSRTLANVTFRAAGELDTLIGLSRDATMTSRGPPDAQLCIGHTTWAPSVIRPRKYGAICACVGLCLR